MAEDQEEPTEVVVRNPVVEIIDAAKEKELEEIVKRVSLNLNKDEYVSDTTTRTVEDVPDKATRFIDLHEKREDQNIYDARHDEWGNPIELMGALGNVPPTQMPYMRISGFNNIWSRLRDGVFLDVFEVDTNGQQVLDENGAPKVLYTKPVNIGLVMREYQANLNLAFKENRTKRQAGILVGWQGGDPLRLDADDFNKVADSLFGPIKKQK